MGLPSFCRHPTGQGPQRTGIHQGGCRPASARSRRPRWVRPGMTAAGHPPGTHSCHVVRPTAHGGTHALGNTRASAAHASGSQAQSADRVRGGGCQVAQASTRPQAAACCATCCRNQAPHGPHRRHRRRTVSGSLPTARAPCAHDAPAPPTVVSRVVSWSKVRASYGTSQGGKQVSTVWQGRQRKRMSAKRSHCAGAQCTQRSRVPCRTRQRPQAGQGRHRGSTVSQNCVYAVTTAAKSGRLVTWGTQADVWRDAQQPVSSCLLLPDPVSASAPCRPGSPQLYTGNWLGPRRTGPGQGF